MKCPLPATEERLHQVYERMRQDHEMILTALKIHSNKLENIESLIEKMKQNVEQEKRRSNFEEVSDIPTKGIDTTVTKTTRGILKCR